jgi:hypothetical protein
MLAVAVVALAMFAIVKPLTDRAHWGQIGSYHLRQADIYLNRARDDLGCRKGANIEALGLIGRDFINGADEGRQ